MELPFWINIDKDEIKDIQRQLDGPIAGGTVDQLGFGILFDSISGQLFPWCSTLTTRAKYLLWSPAVLEAAGEILKRNFLKEKDWSYLSKDEQKKLVNIYQKLILDLESYLSLALYVKYHNVNDETGSGIFGVANIKTRVTSKGYRTAGTVLGKGVLSLPARYPNAIYRGSLVNLGLFSDKRMSNLVLLDNMMRDQSPWSREWGSALKGPKAELKKIWEIVKPNLNSDIFEIFPSKFLKNFKGFDLNQEEKFFLKKALLKRTPFWEPILISKKVSKLENKASDFAEIRKSISQINSKELFEMAQLICEITFAYLNTYRALTKGIPLPKIDFQFFNDLEEKRKRLSKLIDQHKEIEPSSRLSGILDYVEQSLKLVNQPEKFVEMMIYREKRVLSGRRKGNKALLRFSKDGKDFRSKEAMKENQGKTVQDSEMVYSENTFRLSSAIEYFKDICVD